MARIAGSERASRSSPLSRMRPEATRALGGSRRITEKAVTDLPQPDSPTSASVSPGAIAKLASRTAVWPGKATVSLSTSSRLTAIPSWLGPRIEDLVQHVAHQVERDPQSADRAMRE